MLNYNEIKELIDIIDKSSLRCFELEGQDIKIKMNKNLEFSQNFEDETVVKNVENRKANNEVSKTELSNSTVSNKVKEEVKNEANEEDGNFKIVKSPLVGTFYSASSPGEEPYAKVGDRVKKGDVLCIIEAMKIMNEITSEYDGEIVEVMCKDDDIIEDGLPLFKIK